MIEATITGGDTLVDKLGQFGPKIRSDVDRTVRQIVIEGQASIVRDKLHGGNPLNSRSGNLARSIQADVNSDGDTVTGTIGVDRTAPYGAVHEYGGTFDVREHLSTSRTGNTFTVRGHTATYPERSFLRSWLRENQGDITAQINVAAGEAVK